MNEALTKPKTAIVKILNLQVILAKEGDSWVAQGIELDYAAAGTSQEDVKKSFQDGLYETIQAHLSRFGDLQQLIAKSADSAVWLGLVQNEPKSQRYSAVSVHEFNPPNSSGFPYGSIRFLIPPDEPTSEAGVH